MSKCIILHSGYADLIFGLVGMGNIIHLVTEK